MNGCGRLLVGGFLVMVLLIPAHAQTAEQGATPFDTMQFIPTSSVFGNEADRFRQLQQVWELANAFEAGTSAVSSYKEPILTRGSRGVALFRQASPAVVLVVVGRVQDGKFQPSGLGTGAIVDSRGYIITNWHVVEGFENALIFFKPLGSAEPQYGSAVVARVVAQSAVKDLALLRIVEPPPSLPVLPLASGQKVEVAEDVHIIGHPRGNYWSYSTGVISQYRPDYSWSYSDASKHRANVLQMQTAINPGNSGGPVLNDLGQIVGLVTMSEDGQNLNYAISLDEIRRFVGINLPPRTRAIQKLPNPSEIPFSFSKAQLATDHVTRAVTQDVEIFVSTRGPTWKAVLRGANNRILEVHPTSDSERWNVTFIGGKSLCVELSDGFVARISAS